MDLMTPSFGLTFWMLVGFGILFFLLKKFAWPMIVGMISKREEYIQEQLSAAEMVRQDMGRLQAEHHKLLAEAKEERDAILADARKVRDKMYDDAKTKASEESRKIIEEAKKAIHFEKMKAVTEIKNEIANMSIEIAQSVLQQELSDKKKSEELVEKLMQNIDLN
ncbi:F0F1 ATP synthase subunit B [Bacteroidales bacterium OttesenSCG-928-B11]|nr:F0F1 ATP synthase subunit B [Bacteroidales bacterium OttesenSCG-928-E04]MDL2312490.1 F0F1 ATP synthase subunit B [Bacteroidales bacterium OttesenSCG-928-B11]MDL2325721.1 F0F1 ATP synthase subunit B [Bacteroidales bacterium OttesenSCG-928-A14]